MSNPFFDPPIVNSPYEYPHQHWELDLAVASVAERVRTGGHDVPAETVRRRFDRGRRNFFTLYRPLADTWRLYDASAITGPRLAATGGQEEPTKLRDPKTWREAAKGYDDE